MIEAPGMMLWFWFPLVPLFFPVERGRTPGPRACAYVRHVFTPLRSMRTAGQGDQPWKRGGKRNAAALTFLTASSAPKARINQEAVRAGLRSSVGSFYKLRTFGNPRKRSIKKTRGSNYLRKKVLRRFSERC